MCSAYVLIMQFAGQGFLAEGASSRHEHQWNTRWIKRVQKAFQAAVNDSDGGMLIRPEGFTRSTGRSCQELSASVAQSLGVSVAGAQTYARCYIWAMAVDGMPTRIGGGRATARSSPCVEQGFAEVRSTYVVLPCAHLDHREQRSKQPGCGHMLHDAAEHRWQR